MKFAIYLGLFGTSMIKFMFAPFIGPRSGISFIETYLVCCIGALVSAAIFYYLSEFFMIRAHKKRRAKIEAALKSGVPLKPKKNFTFANKLVVKTKHIFGIYGISMYAPFFFSIPLGSIIAAKFYGKLKKTFPLIVLGIFVNGLITTSLAYLFSDMVMDKSE